MEGGKDEGLSLEKLKIHERLKDLEISNARVVSHLESERGTWERYTSYMHKTIDRIEQLLKKHDEILLGDTKPGVLTKMDRFEQSEIRRDWHFKAIWTAIVGLIAKVIHGLLG